MVCLYGTTLEQIKAHVMATQNIDITNSDFADWNWLVHLLSKYIYNQTRALALQQGDTLPESPFIPESEDRTPWARWFFRTLASLKKEFDDATPQLALKSMENPPTEDVAQIIYDATSLNIQMSFRLFLQTPLPLEVLPIPTLVVPNPAVPNPAAAAAPAPPNKAPTLVTIPGMWQEDPTLPALIPFIPPPVPLYKQKPMKLLSPFDAAIPISLPIEICMCDDCQNANV